VKGERFHASYPRVSTGAIVFLYKLEVKVKKVLFLFTAMVLLASCGGSGQPNPANTTTQTETPEANDEPEAQAIPEQQAAPQSPNADGFIFVYDGESVYMGEDMSAVLARLGEPKTALEAPSCAFPGEIDKVYGYAGANILTFPDDGVDYVYMVNYMDDSITTPEGIRLGDTLDDVTAAYGGGYTEEMSQYTYTKGDTYLRFLLDGEGFVISITYGLSEYMEVL
jgi:hypothetical protein